MVTMYFRSCSMEVIYAVAAMPVYRDRIYAAMPRCEENLSQ